MPHISYNRIVFFCAVLVLATGYAGSAFSSDRPISDNPEVICDGWEPNTVRSTTVLLDPSIIDTEDRTFKWFESLRKLEFVEREPVKVFVIEPSTGELIDSLDLCYPSFTDQEKAENPGGFMAASLERREKDLIKGFERRLEKAASQAFEIAEKNSDNNFDMLEVFATQSAKFADEDRFTRLVMMTGLASQKVSDAVKSMEGIDNLETLSVFGTYPLNIGLFEVVVYGAKIPVESPERQFWMQYFASQGGSVLGLSSTMPLTPSLEVDELISMRGHWMMSDNTDLTEPAKLNMVLSSGAEALPIGSVGFYTPDGWIHVPFKGSYACASVGQDCNFDGTVTSSIPFGSEDPLFQADVDEIVLSGSYSELSGRVKPGQELDVGEHGEKIEYLLELKRK